MADNTKQPRQKQGGGQQGQGDGSGGEQRADRVEARRSREVAPTATGSEGAGNIDGLSAASTAEGVGSVAQNYVPRMKAQYLNDVVPAMTRDFNYANRMQVPRIEKVVINIGMGSEARDNAKAIDNAAGDVATVTGQKPVTTRAKKSIAAFKLRTGMPIGVMVTLRGPRMYDFYDKLVNIALARVRDFNGVSPQSFDGHGNFTLGLREQLIFPEIDYDKVDKIRGMEIVVVTSARNDEEGRRLLELMGMPFRK